MTISQIALRPLAKRRPRNSDIRLMIGDKDRTASALATIKGSTSRFKSPTRWKLPALGIALALSVFTSYCAVQAATVPEPASNSGPSCLAQYNAKLIEAKAALVKGDRTGALASLIEAKDRLARCEERERDSSSGATDTSFNVAPDGPVRMSFVPPSLSPCGG